jgi:SnoaL-like domain
MADPRSVFERFMAAMNGRNTAALDDLLHADFDGSFPQSGEVTRGIANLKATIDNYPGAYEDRGGERVIGGEDRWVTTPTFTLLRIEGTGSVFTGVQKARYPDGTDWHVVTIGEVKDGKIWRVDTFFAQDFEAPAWRAPWVELRDRT